MKNKFLKSSFCLLLASIFSLSCFTGCSSDKESIQDKIIVNNKYGTYYFSGRYLFRLNDDNTVTPIKYNYTDESGEETTQFVTTRSDNIYFDNKICNFEYALSFCYAFNDDSDILQNTVFIDEETLNNSVLSISNEYSIGSMSHLNELGDYIYFINIPGMDYFQTFKSKAYRLGRMKKDGSQIEFLNDEIASDYTIYNDWIYFFDNGYTYNTSKNEYETNGERIGIYKMKKDGSDKTLLLDGFDKNQSIDNSDYCFNMNVYGDYIYFIDISGQGESKLFRMKPDGTDVEPLTKNGVQNYTVDGNTLYYTIGTNNQLSIDDRTFYSVSLETGEETELFKLHNFTESTFTVYNNYIYFHNDHQYETGNYSGARYNPIEKTMEYLNFIQETRTTTEGVLGVEKKTLLPPKCYWESVEPTKSSNGQLVYWYKRKNGDFVMKPP